MPKKITSVKPTCQNCPVAFECSLNKYRPLEGRELYCFRLVADNVDLLRSSFSKTLIEIPDKYPLWKKNLQKFVFDHAS